MAGPEGHSRHHRQNKEHPGGEEELWLLRCNEAAPETADGGFEVLVSHCETLLSGLGLKCLG